MNKINLGSLVKDRFTYFEGTAIAYTMRMSGYNSYLIQSVTVRDGKFDELWFDEQRVSLVKAEKAPSTKVGGPQRDPSR